MIIGDTREERAVSAAQHIIDDLTGRSGFDNLWGDLPREIQQEILKEIADTLLDL
jgi:hypothetical protein